MGKIIIRGDFTLEGDVPGLDMICNEIKICKRFKVAVLETMEYPSIRLTQFTGIEKIKGVK